MANSKPDPLALATAFEALLRRHGITIAQGSDLEAIILDIYSLSYGPAPSAIDPRIALRHLAGFTDLAALILSVSTREDFGALLPHLRLLNKGRALQNIPSPPTDQATNKLFELYISCLAMRCGTSVSVDDPDHSSGNNPDVIATIGDSSWGFACKVLHGQHPQSVLSLVEDGLRQIEVSAASTGLVLINLKNVLNHDSYLPMPSLPSPRAPTSSSFLAFHSSAEALEALTHEVQTRGAGLLGHADPDAIKALFNGRKALPAFAFWGQTLAAIPQGPRPFFVSLHVINLQEVEPLTAAQKSPLTCFNRVLLDP